MFFFSFQVRSEIAKYELRGGNEKLKQVTKNEIATVKNGLRELLTYDVPQGFKKMFRHIFRRKF